MLSYAFQMLDNDGFKKVGTEDFDNISDLFSAILIKGVSTLVKRGLEKEYKQISEEISTIKGKIDVSETMKRESLQRKKACCSFDELTVDSYVNQIIKTTFFYLLKSDANIDYKRKLKKLLVYFEDVSLIPVNTINWKFQYNKNNISYRMILSICYLVINGLLQTTDDGDIKLANFLDEQRMCRLYEKFILEFYKKEKPELSANASKINWKIDDNYDFMLPEMKSDIMLYKGDIILIIDAKYYEHSTQKNYDIEKIRSGNIYQIFTYVKNKQLEDETKNVSGMLLYAKTEDFNTPNVDYKLSGNLISAKALDLNQNFDEIKNQLLSISDKYFS